MKEETNTRGTLLSGTKSLAVGGNVTAMALTHVTSGVADVSTVCHIVLAHACGLLWILD